MRMYTWNVNGIRAVVKKGFFDWFYASGADVVCVQETKAQPEQLDKETVCPEGYESYWHSAEKKGYSGVATYSKVKPLNVIAGLGDEVFDREGRVLTLEFSDLFLVNAYFPNSQREHTRLGYKLEFCGSMHSFLKELRKTGKDVVLCGDYNIAHRAIDLKNPKQNENNAGFLPEERAWMDRFLQDEYVDIFRAGNKEPDQYTWWSYRPGVRDRNIGWRLDYFCANEDLLKRVDQCVIQPGVMGSDHCPVALQLN